MNPEQEVRQKKLTRFLCHELLYEYATGALSPQRDQEMREYISSCHESQRELEKLKRGHSFAQRASDTRVSPALKEALLSFEPYWQKRARNLTLWSSQRGWRMLPYAFIGLTLITGLLVLKPWRRTQEHNDILLAEQLKKEPDMVAPPAEPPAVEVPQVAVAEPATTAATSVEPPPPQPPPPVESKKETPKAPTEPVKPVEKAEVAMNKAMPGSPRGFLLRSEMEVSDFTNTWPMIRDKIVALGGKVAGNVELGWLRRPNQSYFHFSLPESNLAELELFLGTFGPVRFSKERHPRVMPEGQIRIILTVKDAITDEGSSATP